MPRPSRARDLVRDAAARVARERGAGVLAGAHRVAPSGVTRGGVTYPFPTEDALLRALVERDRDRWERRMIEHRARADGAMAPRAVAYIRAVAADAADRRRFVAGTLSAVAQDPTLLDGRRARYRRRVDRSRWSDADRDERLPMRAADRLVRMAPFGFLALPMTVRRRRVARLEARTSAAAARRRRSAQRTGISP